MAKEKLRAVLMILFVASTLSDNRCPMPLELAEAFCDLKWKPESESHYEFDLRKREVGLPNKSPRLLHGRTLGSWSITSYVVS